MSTSDPIQDVEVLLLDFGGVCLLNPVELHFLTESRLGLDPGTFEWLGPIAPETDPLWQRLVADEGVSEPEYWATRAADVGKAAGIEMSLQDYMRLLFDPATPEIVRPEAMSVVASALDAGFGVSVLTNDMRSFHGTEWEHDVELLGMVDHVVDCSDTGILKPDRRAFSRALDIIGVSADKVLFIDDQPKNVTGAEACGIPSRWFDIANATSAWDSIAQTLGLDA